MNKPTKLQLLLFVVFVSNIQLLHAQKKRFFSELDKTSSDKIMTYFRKQSKNNGAKISFETLRLPYFSNDTNGLPRSDSLTAILLKEISTSKTCNWYAFPSKNPAEAVLIKKASYDNENIDSIISFLYYDGSLAASANYRNGVIQQPLSVYYPTGAVFAFYSFNNGVMDGEQKTLYRDNAPQSIFFMKEGVYHGEYTSYYSNAQVFEQKNYSEGLLEGVYSRFHDNGQIAFRIHYVRGKPMHIEFVFDKYGNARDKGTLTDGNGTLHFYTDEGELLRTEQYKDGIKINED